ncbi:MAG: hypothetical protein K9I36_11955 [Bacteroidia bacterium]|nr:hypothetical protein [Bacteroidia bacterium]MCF8427439.1 hypothetical protein [Bacteroidia bacterium]
MAEETPVLLSKRKNIQVLLDYCLDQRVGFTVSPRAISNDDFEIEVNVGGIKQAIALGMFAKENKIEVAGMGDLIKPKPTAAKKVEPKEVFMPTAIETASETPKEEGSLLSFDLNVNDN